MQNAKTLLYKSICLSLGYSYENNNVWMTNLTSWTNKIWHERWSTLLYKHAFFFFFPSLNFLGKIGEVCNRQWNCGASHLSVGNCTSNWLSGCKFSCPTALWGMFRWTGSHRPRQAGFFNKWNSRKRFYICGKKCFCSILFSIKCLWDFICLFILSVWE